LIYLGSFYRKKNISKNLTREKKYFFFWIKKNLLIVLQQIFNPYSFSLTHSLLILYLLVGTNRRLCYLVLNDDVWLIYESFSYTILNNVVADLSFGQVVRTFSQCVANVFSCGSQFSIAFSSLEHVDLSQLCVTECKKNIWEKLATSRWCFIVLFNNKDC
jgi:hypothetical protein